MGDDDEHQRPLSLRFETKRFWGDFRRELKVDQTGAAIILDICNADGAVSYSRNAVHYSMPHRYRNPLYTWRRVVSQMDLLHGLGLIEHDRRPPGALGWQSAVRATDELRAICASIIGGAQLTFAKPAEVILLRDKGRRLIDYRETRDVGRMRKRTERFNEAIFGEIDPTIAAPLARIFNVTMKRGGRFYAMGSSWQNMKAEARKTLTIGGEKVVELDYRNLHPAILYAEVGAEMPRDCYDLDGWPRKLVKVAMLTLINARTRQAARLSIANNDKMTEVAKPGSQEALNKADELIGAIKAAHKAIAAAFHSDKGAELMTIDATMAEAVMNLLLTQGIVVLPVHDSFLVPASQKDKLEEAMLRAAYDMGMWALEVDEK